MKSLLLPVFSCILLLNQGLYALELRTLELGSGKLMPDRYVKVDDGYALLSFSALQPSKVIKVVTQEAVLPLFDMTKDSEGKVVYSIVDRIKVSFNSKGILLLGWVGPKGAQYLPIDDDYLSAKFNDWLFVNASNRQIAFQIGRQEKPLLINPNGIANHKIKSTEGSGTEIIGMVRTGEKVKTFYSTYWPIRAGERGIVIFYDRGERIGVNRITDVLFKKEKAEAAQAIMPAKQPLPVSP